MRHRPLGQTGLLVSPIGLGTVKLGRVQGVKYPAPYTIPDDAAAADLLARALELGVNLIDTAPAYGESEERLGGLLKGQRDRWVISTKVGEVFENGVSRFDFSPKAVRESVERSLRRLRTDRVEIVLLHSDGSDTDILEGSGALEALFDLQREGKVQAVGASTKTVAGGLLAVECCDVVMLTYNLRDRDDGPAIRAAHGRGVGVLIKKGLMSGHLGDVAAADPVGASLRFVLGEAGVSCVVVGTIDAGHLGEAVRCAEVGGA